MVYVPAGADVATGPWRRLTWRAGPPRGATGTEATWQNPGGPHEAHEAHSIAATWQEATRSRDDVDARRTLDSIRTAEIKTRFSQGGGQ